MATMLNGAAVMDGALLLVAANETCPQPQTSEHLAAIEIMRLQHILILQNKIDLIRCSPQHAVGLQSHQYIAWSSGQTACWWSAMGSCGSLLERVHKQHLQVCLWDLPGPKGRLACNSMGQVQGALRSA